MTPTTIAIGQELSEFYPTPPSLAKKMLSKVKEQRVVRKLRVLEPSAGKGDLIEEAAGRMERYGDGRIQSSFFAIEINEDLQAVLRCKNIPVIDSDFLSFSGPDKFDLILMNPPFSNGAAHLLKAIEIMYCGQIICLLNAETLRNPYSRTRKDLVEKLESLGAEIEYVSGAFAAEDAERKTDVEVAIVSIEIDQSVANDLFGDIFAGADDVAEEINVEDHLGDDDRENYEVVTGHQIEEMVAEHDQIVRDATEMIIEFYRFKLGNRRKLGRYVNLSMEILAGIDWSKPSRTFMDESARNELTKEIQDRVNEIAANVRKDFWRRTLDLSEVWRRLTESKAKEFNHEIEQRSSMAFTENNIRAFVLNIIGSYKQSLRSAVVDLFDRLSQRHSWSDSPFEKNVHYYNGWKTNKAWKVGKKVIIPIYGSYCGDRGPFRGYSGRWELDWSAKQELRDIDIVMNYFDGMKPHYQTVARGLEVAFSLGINQGYSTYFEKIIAYKKGTLHLTFADKDILRRFNVEAAKGKGWLPEDYGVKPYKKLDVEHREVVDSFEGQKEYDENLGRTGLMCVPWKLAIEAPKKATQKQASIFDTLAN